MIRRIIILLGLAAPAFLYAQTPATFPDGISTTNLVYDSDQDGVADDSEAVGGTPAASMATDAELASHTGDTANPHTVTKSQVGLGNVDNTSDADKPISTAQAATNTALQASIDLKQDASTASTDTERQAHENDTANPHDVSATQVGLIFTPSSYTPASSSVEDNVEGLDFALGAHAGDTTSNPHLVDSEQVNYLGTHADYPASDLPSAFPDNEIGLVSVNNAAGGYPDILGVMLYVGGGSDARKMQVFYGKGVDKFYFRGCASDGLSWNAWQEFIPQGGTLSDDVTGAGYDITGLGTIGADIIQDVTKRDYSNPSTPGRYTELIIEDPVIDLETLRPDTDIRAVMVTNGVLYVVFQGTPTGMSLGKYVDDSLLEVTGATPSTLDGYFRITGTGTSAGTDDPITGAQSGDDYIQCDPDSATGEATVMPSNVYHGVPIVGVRNASNYRGALVRLWGTCWANMPANVEWSSAVRTDPTANHLESFQGDIYLYTWQNRMVPEWYIVDNGTDESAWVSIFNKATYSDLSDFVLRFEFICTGNGATDWEIRTGDPWTYTTE